MGLSVVPQRLPDFASPLDFVITAKGCSPEFRQLVYTEHIVSEKSFHDNLPFQGKYVSVIKTKDVAVCSIGPHGSVLDSAQAAFSHCAPGVSSFRDLGDQFMPE